ncbi:phage holin family protein [bacterium]|nr:phage holin family protein [bacterium]
MRDFVIRVFINAIAILVTAELLKEGIVISDNSVGTLLMIGLVIALINAFVKPILKFLSCPLVLITFGLFVLVINGLLLMLADTLLPELTIKNPLYAIVAGIVMAIISTILEAVLLRMSRR